MALIILVGQIKFIFVFVRNPTELSGKVMPNPDVLWCVILIIHTCTAKHILKV